MVLWFGAAGSAPRRALGPADDFDGPVLVMAVNEAYMPLLINWMCGRLEAGLGDPHQDTVLVAQDQQVRGRNTVRERLRRRQRTRAANCKWGLLRIFVCTARVCYHSTILRCA